MYLFPNIFFSKLTAVNHTVNKIYYLKGEFVFLKYDSGLVISMFNS
jgi:hypothetical protein